MAIKLGVDFGTTRTVVACADRGNYPVISFTDELGDARDWFPSVVADQGGELIFGFDALAVTSDPACTVVRSFKRLLADSDAVPGRVVRIGATEITLGELVTRFLVALREAILYRSNVPRSAKENDGVLSAVVATPANAHGAQRLLTLDAFRRAGFDVVSLLNEPSAAGFEYSHRHRDTFSSKRENVVVYDLGGGTFDASLVRMRERTHEVLATAGLNRLGGDDFDEALARLVLAHPSLSSESHTPQRARALERVRDQCREAKERLNPSSKKITIDLEAALESGAPMRERTIAVSEFYEACLPLVERTVEAMTPVIARLEGEPIEESMADVAGIYVVGGGSELPIVARALRHSFGRRVHRSPYPSATRTFGVFREANAGGEITFDPIFVPGTELPISRFRPAHDAAWISCGAQRRPLPISRMHGRGR